MATEYTGESLRADEQRLDAFFQQNESYLQRLAELGMETLKLRHLSTEALGRAAVAHRHGSLSAIELDDAEQAQLDARRRVLAERLSSDEQNQQYEAAFAAFATSGGALTEPAAQSLMMLGYWCLLAPTIAARDFLVLRQKEEARDLIRQATELLSEIESGAGELPTARWFWRAIDALVLA